RDLFAAPLLRISEAQQIQILQPLSDEADRQHRATLTANSRAGGEGGIYYVPRTDKTETEQRPNAIDTPSGSPADVPVAFFRLLKNLTADGYYTSRIGLVDELGYTGNTALGQFPSCPVPEH